MRAVLPKGQESQSTLSSIRGALLVILTVGLLGTGVELLLLGHTEGATQLIPVVLIALCLAALLWHAVSWRASSVRTLQGVMLLLLICGIAGQLLHYRSNVEFELEMYPSLSGFELFREAMSGAMPVLAPGALIQMGLLGLAYTHRHPALSSSIQNSPSSTGE